MDQTQVNRLRRANEIPFQVVRWLEELTPVVEHDEFGTIYKGCILAEDGYGKYAAIIGTTDELLRTHIYADDATPFRVLKIEKRIVAFGR